MLLWTLGCIYLFKLMCLFLFLFWFFIYTQGWNYWIIWKFYVYYYYFLGTSTLFSTAAAPTYIPTNSVWGFPFLYILANNFVFFLIIAIQTCMRWYLLWFWFEFPLMIRDWNNFSCACWPFAFPLWKNVYSVFLLIFNQVVCFSVEFCETFVYVRY